MEIPQEGKYVCKLNGQLVIYEASTGSLCGAVPCVMVESGFPFKHTLVLVKADGTIQTKTTDTLKAVFGWDGLDPFTLMDNSVDGGPMRSVEFEIVGGPETGDKGGVYFKSQWLKPAGWWDEDAHGGGPAIGAGEVWNQVPGARWCFRSGGVASDGSDGRAEDPQCSQVCAGCATAECDGDDGRGLGGAE